MFSNLLFHRIDARRRLATRRSSGHSHNPLRKSTVESLESRVMLSLSASAQLTLTSTTGTMANPVYHYDITVTNTGTTNIGTFWFSWVPGEDFLPTAPLSESSPSGWAAALTGSGNQSDGTAIQWVASSNKIAPGQSLSGYDFTSTDSLAVLAGASPSHPSQEALTSFVYIGQPLADPGFQLTVDEASSGGSAATTTGVTTSNSSIHSGDSVTLTATIAPVTPGGATPTGTVSFTQNGNSLGSAQVGSDGTAVLQTTALAAGTDSVVATYGGDSTYASSMSAPVNESVTAAPTPTTLAPTIAKSTVASQLVAGTTALGTVTVDVTNPTASTVKGKANVEVFASSDGVIDSSSIDLAHSARVLNLGASKLAAFALSTRITAAELPAGSYTLLARVIDPAGNNSDTTTGPSVTVAAPFISLSETFTRVTIPASAAAGARSGAVATLQITNNGNITTPGKTMVALFASMSGIVDGNATLINSLTLPLRIRAGKSMRLVIPVKKIPTVAVGTYTILAQVTDPNGLVTTATAGTLDITSAPVASISPPVPPPPPSGGFY